MNIQDLKLSLFQFPRAYISVLKPFQEILRLIQYDDDVNIKTKAFRQKMAEMGKQTANELIKEKLVPAFGVAVTYKGHGHSKSEANGWTGLALCDIDNIYDPAELEATFERQGDTFSTLIRKVYPEVRDGKFKADFKFDGEQPDNIRSGQTYYLNLQLGQPEEAILIPRGSFYQQTGGKWIYVVNKDGNRAVKREIRIGRQNPQYYEVLEGLEPGEKVITSGYETYGDSDVLIF